MAGDKTTTEAPQRLAGYLDNRPPASLGRTAVSVLSCVGFVVATLTFPSIIAGPGPSPRQCSDIVLVAAPGSEAVDAGPDRLGATGRIFHDTLLRRLSASGQTLQVRVVDHSRPAVFFDDDIGAALDPDAVQLRTEALGPYYDSQEAGRTAARRAVDTAVKEIKGCAGYQRIVLFGLSQGAQVMGDVLQSLPKRSRELIAGAALFADPRFNPDEGPAVVRGDFDPRRSGLFGARPLMPADLSGKFLSACRDKDLACQGLRLGTGPPPGYCPVPIRMPPGTGAQAGGYFDVDCRAGDANVHRQYLMAAFQAASELSNRLGLFGERMGLPSPPRPTRPLDVVFLIDTTASMTEYAGTARTAINDVADTLVAAGGDYRFGVASFRDTGDAYLSRVDLALTSDVESLRSSLRKVSTAGGSDVREAVHSGLMTAFSMDWRGGAKRAVVMLGDGPPKDPEPGSELSAGEVTDAARAVSAVVYPVIAGDSELARAPLTAMAAATGGRPFPITSLDAVGPSVAAALTEATHAPLAQFNGRNYSGVAGTPVRLWAVASYDMDGDIVRYEWDFESDGQVDAVTTDGAIDHVYPAGTYRAALRVVDNDGQMAETEATVAVAETGDPAQLDPSIPVPWVSSGE